MNPTPVRPRSSTLACWICVLATAALAALLAGRHADAADTAAEARAHATALSTAFREAAAAATPSVVLVRSEVRARREPADRQRRGGGGRGQQQDNPFRGTPFEDMFPDGVPDGFRFEMPEGRGPSRSGVGSGVIVDASGIVLTNNHVVEDADEVTVELTDGREFKAVEIKTDPESDLAVIRLGDAKDLPVAKLGDSDKLAIGDWVIAIGNPFELETTVSAGIISGKGRELGGIRRAQFLQTDAAINPGNSGGPLVNLSGEVVGINTAIASSSGGYQGVGFAIPANLATWVMRQLIDKGAVERAYIGVQMGPIDARLATKLGIAGRKGVLVNDVVPDSPAAAAGVQEADVITAFDGRPVEGTRGLQEIVERAGFDKPHELAVIRDGKALTLKISVKPLPRDFAASGGGPRLRRGGTEAAETFSSEPFGIEVRDKASLAEDAYEGFAGVVVDRVDPDGLAAAAGVGPGVLVRAVDKTEVGTVAEFAKAIEGKDPAAGVLLKVRTPRGNAIVLLQKR
ncbi:MAG: Do family serine endopeptidase [Planctomycetaceae bacterium]